MSSFELAGSRSLLKPSIVALLFSCLPQTSPSVETPKLLDQLTEPHAIAGLPNLGGEAPNSAFVYVTESKVLRASTTGGGSFTQTFTFEAPEDTNAPASCIRHDSDTPVLAWSDTDVIMGDRGVFPLVGVPPAYASVLAFIGPPGSTNPVPNAVMLVKSAANGSIEGSHIQCLYVPRPTASAVMDKTSLALDESLHTDDFGQWRTLYVAWNDGGETPTSNGQKVKATQSYLQAIPIDPYNGGMRTYGLPAPRLISAPVYNSIFAGGPPFYHGPCTNPSPIGKMFIDDTARGNLWGTNGPVGGGRLYYAFSNVTGVGESSGIVTRRVYVERLDPPNEFIACVDQFDADVFASQGDVEEHDPEMVVDPQTDTIGLVYARPDSSGRERIIVAGGSSDGQTWTYREVDPTDPGGDQSQPAIALTTYDDILDRVFSGTIMVTWYRDAGDRHVVRAARGFLPFASHQWGPTTAALTISAPPPFVPLYGQWDPVFNRGVLEYQGVAHLPGYAAPGTTAAGGGWLGVWTQPYQNFDQPSTNNTDQATLWTRWP